MYMLCILISLHGMQYIKGTERSQAVLFPQSLDEIIDNELRILDLFVESIPVTAFRFHLKSSFERRLMAGDTTNKGHRTGRK